MKTWRAISLLAGAALIGLATIALSPPGPSRAQSVLAGIWTKKHPLPTVRSEVYAATVGGKIYVIGGQNAERPDLYVNDEYDPATDTWRERAGMPHGMNHTALAASDGKIYAAGGFAFPIHVGAHDLFFSYDPATDKWQNLAPLSSPRASIGLVALDGKIHAIGGRGLDKVTVATHEVYDPATNTWTKAAPLPVARDHAGVVAVDGKIHVIGGRTKEPVDNVVLHDIYDPQTDRWTSGPPLPEPRSAGAAVYYHGLILYVGGECKNNKPFDLNEAFDPKTGKWMELAPLPGARHGFGGVAIGDTAYFAGGWTGSATRCADNPTDELLAFTVK
ncbi:MAG TPA: kelch repeat-containing protein [Stellaceae bacterium]